MNYENCQGQPLITFCRLQVPTCFLPPCEPSLAFSCYCEPSLLFPATLPVPNYFLSWRHSFILSVIMMPFYFILLLWAPYFFLSLRATEGSEAISSPSKIKGCFGFASQPLRSSLGQKRASRNSKTLKTLNKIISSC